MTRTVRKVVLIAAGVLTSMTAGLAAAEPEEHVPTVIIAFGTMYGVDEGFVGEANPVRGVVGDELPWTVGSARGRLDVSGHLKLRVRGLVFTDDPEVPPELRGKNDEDHFRALVSCLSEDEAGGIITANVTTGGFPATESGDADIDAQVALPNPCVAPIIFILAGSEEKWFAVTGFESEGGSEEHPAHGPSSTHGPGAGPGFTSVPRR